VTDHTVIGKPGRVTGRVAAGTIGEVIVAVRGGTEAFCAHPLDPKEVFEKGERVIVIEYEEPRTVLVSRYE
jgi:hypothetical protein